MTKEFDAPGTQLRPGRKVWSLVFFYAAGGDDTPYIIGAAVVRLTVPERQPLEFQGHTGDISRKDQFSGDTVEKMFARYLAYMDPAHACVSDDRLTIEIICTGFGLTWQDVQENAPLTEYVAIGARCPNCDLEFLLSVETSCDLTSLPCPRCKSFVSEITDSMKPWRRGIVKCRVCGDEHRAVYHESTEDALECNVCHEMTCDPVDQGDDPDGEET